MALGCLGASDDTTLDDLLASKLVALPRDDLESAHEQADELLAELLEWMGLRRSSEAYRSIAKWLA